MRPLTRVVNLRKAPYDVYIGRAGNGHDGYFGNPHALYVPCYCCDNVIHDRGSCLRAYEKTFRLRFKEDEEFMQRIIGLRGKTLGCFCKPKPCHGDIIAAFLNGDLEI